MSLQLRWATIMTATAMAGGLTACGADIASMSTSMFMPGSTPPSKSSHQLSSHSNSQYGSQSDSDPDYDVDPEPEPESVPMSNSRVRECHKGLCTVTVSGASTQSISLADNDSETAERQASTLVISDFAADSVWLGMGTEKKQVQKGRSVGIDGWTFTLQSVDPNALAAKLVYVPKS
ncbi:hypothetical protein [Nonomuraea sp. bgisy101]|uniref:hypothetical protein n=1 Tax=Nonomuraea sp. bgisy101 TaxID=3413784 RepID=UPI003D75E879